MRAEQDLRRPPDEPEFPEHCFNGDGAESASPTNPSAGGEREDSAGLEGVKLLLQQFSELREYASYYASTQMDGLKASIRRAIARIVVSALVFVTVGGLIVMASWMMLSGMAQGLGTLFGDRPWIGPLVTGMVALLCSGVVVLCVGRARREKARKRTVEKYEARHEHQRKRFGRDAHDREPTPSATGE